MAAKDRILKYLIKNVGKKVLTRQIRRVAGISEYARRIRELRDEDGYPIISHNDRVDLKSGEYVLLSTKRRPKIAREIDPKLRNAILERNGYTCQCCGAGAGDEDPYNPGRKVRLHVDHIKPLSQGGTNKKDNLRVLCSTCNQGKSNVQPPSETALNVIAKIRKIAKKEQRNIYRFLKNKFEFK